MNLLHDLPSSVPTELFETLHDAANVRIERIVSYGHVSPPDFWYDQAEGEWILLLAGAARLQFEDREVELRPGDYLNIRAHERHRVAWTSPRETTIWLAVFYG